MEDLGIINRKLDGNLHTCIKSQEFPTPSHRLFLHRWAYSRNMMEIFVESTISRIQKTVWLTITARAELAKPNSKRS